MIKIFYNKSNSSSKSFLNNLTDNHYKDFFIKIIQTVVIMLVRSFRKQLSYFSDYFVIVFSLTIISIQ